MLNSLYRLLLLDIDGTLAKDYYSISPEVKKAIIKISKKLSVVLVSGRSAKTVILIAKELKLNKPQIVEGGARIITSEGNNIWARFLRKESVSNIIDCLNSFNKSFNMCIHGSSQVINNKKEFKQVDLAKVTRISSLSLENSQAKKIENLLQQIKGINFFRVRNAFKENLWNIDITDKKANKKNAVLKLRKILNIKKEETVGVGDGFNDIPFIKETGLKVAMGNAVSELKEISDYIAPSVTEDGLIEVVRIINRLCQR